jgi:hypothetical protein
MQRKNNNSVGRHEHPLSNEITDKQREQAAAAHEQADRDMEDDVELTSGSPNDDLDEGESARLGEETDLI